MAQRRGDGGAEHGRGKAGAAPSGTLHDDLGYPARQVGPVRRVVSLVPSLTEPVAVTRPEALVGATDWCTHPRTWTCRGFAARRILISPPRTVRPIRPCHSLVCMTDCIP